MTEVKSQFSPAAEGLPGFTSLQRDSLVCLDSHGFPPHCRHVCTLPLGAAARRRVAARLLLLHSTVQQTWHLPQPSCRLEERVHCSKQGIYAADVLQESFALKRALAHSLVGPVSQVFPHLIFMTSRQGSNWVKPHVLPT